MPAPLPLVSDLAPGDAKSAGLDLAAFTIHRIRRLDDPHFETAYARLWAEFGPRQEMERRETLATRFGLAPAMQYEIVLGERDGAFAAVRDYTVIPGREETVVHLSHIFVAPDFRRSGLAGWMRALPVATARELAPGIPIVLVAEMEYDDGSDPARSVRLRAYEKAGFRKVDPQVVHFHQPDFRAPAEIDASGVQPVPFQLCLRLVGAEDATTIPGARVRRIVAALYRVYGSQFRPQDMAHPALDLAHYPADDATIALLPPTA
jgi:GNAT superfamily N-acetyltransferase